MDTNGTTRPVALVTGASRGLGRALASALAGRGWHLVVDARTAEVLDTLDLGPRAIAIAGDVTDAEHRRVLARAVRQLGRLDVLVNNASTLGTTPLRPLHCSSNAALTRAVRVNTLAPLALVKLLLPTLTVSNGIVINVSSDAAVEAYAGWGPYGASKAALDHLTAVLAVEHPTIRAYAVDPGDMRTQMHQEAFPGEDISDRPEPQTVVPAFLRLIDERPPSGRYRARSLLAPQQVIA